MRLTDLQLHSDDGLHFRPNRLARALLNPVHPVNPVKQFLYHPEHQPAKPSDPFCSPIPPEIGPAILDEALKEPVIFEKVKYAYDNGGLSFTVLLGSSRVLMLIRIRETLSGRISIYEMWPLMMSEIFAHAAVTTSLPLVDRLFMDTGCDAIFEDQPQILLAEEDECRRRAEDYLLQWGGMPALLHLSDTDRHHWLKDYGYTYLEKDVADLARLDDLMPFRKFQRLTALRSGWLLNYSEVATFGRVRATENVSGPGGVCGRGLFPAAESGCGFIKP